MSHTSRAKIKGDSPINQALSKQDYRELGIKYREWRTSSSHLENPSQWPLDLHYIANFRQLVWVVHTLRQSFGFRANI